MFLAKMINYIVAIMYYKTAGPSSLLPFTSYSFILYFFSLGSFPLEYGFTFFGSGFGVAPLVAHPRIKVISNACTTQQMSGMMISHNGQPTAKCRIKRSTANAGQNQRNTIFNTKLRRNPCPFARFIPAAFRSYFFLLLFIIIPIHQLHHIFRAAA